MATRKMKPDQPALDEAASEPAETAEEGGGGNRHEPADEPTSPSTETRASRTTPRAPSTENPIACSESRSSSPVLAPGDVIEPPAGAPNGASAPILEPHPLDEETLIPVHRMVRLSVREMDVIDHPAFQRTFDVHQLGQTHFVYRGATHMRGQHAIGALHVIALMAEALERNACRGEVKLSAEWQPGMRLTPTELAFVRLGALLHDIGHLAAGHTLEDELGLLPPHDANRRLAMVFDRTDWHGREYESLRDRIDRLYADDARLAAQPDAYGAGAHLSAAEVLLRVVSKDYEGEQGEPGSGFRLGVARDLVGNTICADLLDYLHRDWWHLGKPRHFDPRLLDYLEIRSRRHQGTDREEHALVISLRGGTRPRPDGVTSIMDLLESRYQLSEIALFHRTKVIAAVMLERLIAEYQDTFDSDTERQQDIDAVTRDLLECSDVEMLELWKRRLAARRERHPKRVDAAVDLCRRLRVRALHRELGSYYDDDLLGSGETVRATFSGDPRLHKPDERARDRRRAAANRLAAMRLLEADFDLPVGSIVMYCPPLKMNLKIAGVKVLANNIVDPLAEIEKRDERITGGHLRAQETRFRRLWRVTFGIDREVFAKIDGTELEGLLIKTIETAVLQIAPRGSESAAVIRSVAEKVTQMPDTLWSGRSLLPLETGRENASLYYPGPGQVPSPRAFIGD